MTSTEIFPLIRTQRDRAISSSAAYTRGRVQGMQDAMRHLFHRHVVELPPTARALFLAPHPDDILIGCGGTLQKLMAASVPVRLVYLTDGRAAATEPSEQPAMGETRMREAMDLSKEMDLPPPILMEWDENSLSDEQLFEQRAGQIAAVLSSVRPDSVFVPYLWDQHGDHRIANHLLAMALRLLDRYPRVYGYEAWSVAPPGMVVDISGELDRKKELLECYPSQLALFPYQKMVDIVNRNHASLVGPWCSAAEAFCPFDGRAFCELVESSDLTSPDTLGNEVLTTPPDTW